MTLAYYQEIGRAGRNGATGNTHLLYNQYDFERLNKSIEELPDIKAVEAFYKSFCSKHQIAIGSGLEEQIEFNIVDLAKRFDLPIPKLLSFIKLIQQRGYWQFIESAFSVPKIKFTSTPENWKGLTQHYKDVLGGQYGPHGGNACTRLPCDQLGTHVQDP